MIVAILAIILGCQAPIYLECPGREPVACSGSLRYGVWGADAWTCTVGMGGQTAWQQPDKDQACYIATAPKENP